MHVKALLAGPLAVGREITWPPSFIDGDDEGALARLCYVLGYDQARWNSAVFWVKTVLQFPSTQHHASNRHRTAREGRDPRRRALADRQP